MKDEDEVLADYAVLMERLDEFIVDQKSNHGIGDGIAAVVCIRMSAILCGGHGITKEGFVQFASNHWDMTITGLREARLIK